MFREKILKITHSIGIDEETHKNLRYLKKIYKKSMAQIIKDLSYKEVENSRDIIDT